MKNVLIIGATGNVGKAVRKMLLEKTVDKITLFSRNASALKVDNSRERIISGNVNNKSELESALANQDAVFVALSGNLEEMAKNIVQGMKQMGVKRLVFITSMGIYNEIPASIGAEGNVKNNSMLIPYRKAADVIEKSNLDYTLIRPGWFDNGSTEYEITQKGEPFGGHNVAINSIADLVTKLLQNDNLYSHSSIGINRK